jgi:hypothetical protein
MEINRGQKTKSAAADDSRHGWWRKYFHDCPESATDKLFHVFGTSVKTGKTKVACKLCWKEALAALQREEEERVQANVQDFPRSKEYFENLSKSFFKTLIFFVKLESLIPMKSFFSVVVHR